NAIDVGADVVARDHVAGRAAIGDLHAGAGVAADDVAGRGCGAADQVVGVGDDDAREVRDGSRAGGVQADHVALDGAVVQAADDRVAVPVEAAAVAVPGEGVPGAGGRPTHEGPRGATHVDAARGGASRAAAGDVGADVVALDDHAVIGPAG